MSEEKEITVVVLATSNTEEIQRVELAGAFDWHSVGEVRRAVARVVQCDAGGISLAQWNGEEWVVAAEDPAGFTYHDNSMGVHAMFRWEREGYVNDEDECLHVRRVVYRDAMCKSTVPELNTKGLAHPMKVCRCESVEKELVKGNAKAAPASVVDGGMVGANGTMRCEVLNASSAEGGDKTQTQRDGWVLAMEKEVESMRSAMAELKTLVKSVQASSREGHGVQRVESMRLGEEVHVGAEEVDQEAEARRGDTCTVQDSAEVLVRATGVSVAAVVLAMRRSGMCVAGVSGKQERRGTVLEVRLRRFQTVRGWVQEWRAKVMKRSGVPWRVVPVCG
jgi:hypothetical protein